MARDIAGFTQPVHGAMRAASSLRARNNYAPKHLDAYRTTGQPRRRIPLLLQARPYDVGVPFRPRVPAIPFDPEHVDGALAIDKARKNHRSGTRYAVTEKQIGQIGEINLARLLEPATTLLENLFVEQDRTVLRTPSGSDERSQGGERDTRPKSNVRNRAHL
jgi:hypothetical protein